MSQILRFMAFVVLLAGAGLGMDRLADMGSFPLLGEVRDWLFSLPWLGGLLFHPSMSYSEWVTVCLVLVAAVYLVTHLIHLLFRGSAALVGREHAGLESRHHVRRFFLSAMMVKGILIALQVVLFVTQAASLSQFLRGVVSNPQSLVDLFRTDAVFLVLLGLLIFVWLLKPKERSLSD